MRFHPPLAATTGCAPLFTSASAPFTYRFLRYRFCAAVLSNTALEPAPSKRPRP